jgi:hypothetical protein
LNVQGIPRQGDDRFNRDHRNFKDDRRHPRRASFDRD